MRTPWIVGSLILLIAGVAGAQDSALDGVVYNRWVDGHYGDYGEGTMVQWHRGTVQPGGYLDPSNEVITRIGGTSGGTFEFTAPGFAYPENPVVRFVLTEPKLADVTITHDSVPVVLFPAGLRGWVDLQWNGTKWECVGWGNYAICNWY